MSNSLNNSKAAWIGDGSEGSTLTVNGSDLTIGSATRGTPFNVRLDCEEAVATKDYCFNVKIAELNGNISVGVVQKDEFKPGWKTKGMFCNGNLTNASAALKTSWGPHIKQGDTMGVMVTHGSDKTLKVTFYKDEQCLGTGFALPNNSKTFYPCLHVSGSAKLVVEYPANLPTNTTENFDLVIVK